MNGRAARVRTPANALRRAASSAARRGWLWSIACAFVMLSLELAPIAAVEHAALVAAQEALQDDRPADALESLGPLPGADTTFTQPDERERAVVAATLRGRALVALDQLREARRAYERALTWDSMQIAAAEGLINALTRLEDWPALQQVAGRWALRPESRPELLVIAIDAARAHADALLALDLARLGVARYPEDRRFRIRRAQALTEVGDEAHAATAWRELVRAEPGDATWWRALAAAQQRRGDDAAARRALAVAHAVAPDNAAVAREYLVGLLAAEQGIAAMDLARSLLGDNENADPDLILLAVRAAWLAEDHPRARAWLDRVPEDARTADWQRWSLQLAVVTGDDRVARQAAEALVVQGAADGRIRLHAARLAEVADDPIAAEAHLRAALQDEEPALVHLARLHLARLLLDRDRHDEAARLVRAALDARPDDVAAARLYRAVRRAQVAGARDNR